MENKWISVDERLPEESGEYLIYKADARPEPSRPHVGGYLSGNWISGYHNIRQFPTHWMPLPDPPSKETK